eukprot:PhF_6_TR41357/c1_g1_i7/m.62823
MTVMIILGSSFLVVTIGVVLVVLVVLIFLHYFAITYYNGAWYVVHEILPIPTTLRKCDGVPSWVYSPSGQWAPKISVSIGGPYFSSYSSGALCHLWIWIFLTVGVVTSIASSTVDDSNVCSVVGCIGGVVYLLSGVYHLYSWRVLMCVRTLCIVRGMRYVLMGIGMILGNVTMSSSDVVEVFEVITAVVVIMGLLETVYGAGVKLGQRLSHQK